MNTFQLKIRVFCLVIGLLLSFKYARGQFYDFYDTGYLPSERVEIQTDRDIYICGEDLWFQASYFLNENFTGKPMSQVLYAELYNESEKAVVQKKIKLDKSTTWGKITIPKEVATGNYFLRIYTLYQQNFGAHHLAMVPIIVVNPDIPISDFSLKNEENIKIIPAGGNFVAGINNQLIIKLKSNSFREADSLFITSDSRGFIKNLDLLPNGLTNVTLKPNANEVFRLNSYLTSGDTLVKRFPEVVENGFKVKTDYERNYILYSLVKTAEYSFGSNQFTLDFLGHDLIAYHSEPLELSHSSIQEEFLKEKLKPGFNYLVLRDDGGEIVAVNSVFRHIPTKENLRIELEKENFNSREKVTAQIYAANSKGSQLQSVSVDVVQKTSLNKQDSYISPLVIDNPILLDWELKKRTALDSALMKQIQAVLILLDHQLVNDADFRSNISQIERKQLDYLPETRSLTLRGEVRDKKMNESVQDVVVYNSILFKNPEFHATRTNENGEFIFSLTPMYGKQDVFLSPQGKQNQQKYQVLLHQNFCSKKPPVAKSPLYLDEEIKEELEQLLVNQQVKHTFYTTTANDSLNPANSDKLFTTFGQDRNTINMDNYIDLETMEQVFVELTPSVRVTWKNEIPSFRIIKEFTSGTTIPGKPLVLLDNIPIYNGKKIMEIHPEQIDNIEVINQPYMLGSLLIQGVIMIHTKKQNFAGVEFPEGSVFLEYETFEKQPEIHFSEFDEPGTPNARIPVFRSVLYWNPDLKLNKEGQNIVFSTTDRKGEYLIRIHGYNSKGEFIKGEKVIHVGNSNQK